MKKHNYIVERHAQAIAEKIKREVEQISIESVLAFLSAKKFYYNMMIESLEHDSALKKAVCKRVIAILFKR